MDKKIDKFLSSPVFAVAGASNNRKKYGNKVLRCYMQHKKEVYPVNPQETKVEGIESFSLLSKLPKYVESLSIITPPKITEQLVQEAIHTNIKNIWMQPGSENFVAIDFCNKNKINIIATGECVLVVLGYNDSWTPKA